jgi:hypothetical protein
MSKFTVLSKCGRRTADSLSCEDTVLRIGWYRSTISRRYSSLNGVVVLAERDTVIPVTVVEVR